MSAAASSSTSVAATPAIDRRTLFADRNLRWLAAGGLVSMLGDQLTLVALPWLVLRLTDDPLALGTVMAAMGLPRAVLMLVGGAVTDRHSPRRVLLVTRQLCAALLAALALLLALGALQLWMVTAFAVAMGVATAFGFPAGSAMLPRAVPPALIRPANGLLMSMRQVTMLLGPLTAGALIAGGHAAPHAHAGAAYPAADATGLSWAFGLDALSFVIATLALLPVRLLAVGEGASGGAAGKRPSLLASIGEGLSTLWRDVPLRTLCLYVAAMGLLIGGPLQVALPVLVNRQIGGADALGLLLAGHGAGILAGMLLAGWKPHWRLGTLGATVLAIDAVAGAVFIAFGQVHALWQAVALLAPLGALGGFVQVAVMSWIQRRVPPHMLGRAMSLFMCLVLGLAPLSAALAGALMRQVAPGSVFLACGAAMLAIVAVGALASPMRRIREEGDAARATAAEATPRRP